MHHSVTAVLATGCGGIAVILTLLFVSASNINMLQNLTGQASIDDYIGKENAVGNLVVDTFILAAGKTWGEGLAYLVLINFFFAGLSSVAVTGRITFALAR